jgi:hypothetical protein
MDDEQQHRLRALLFDGTSTGSTDGEAGGGSA